MRQPIDDGSTWLGSDIQNSDRWRHQLSVEDVEEIVAALGAAKDAGASIENLSKATFPLRGFADRINVMLDELEDGLGLYLFQGFPALDFSNEDLRLIYWGIGLYCGHSVSQSKRGDVLGDVRDIGTPLDGPEFRGYTSNGELTYHSDAADVTALFCLRAAKEGGLSRIVSLSYVHNEILRTRPDLLEVLYADYNWGRQGNELPGQSPYYTQPIFSVHQGKFAGRYTRTHIRTAEMSDEIGGLNDRQSEALDLIDTICARSEIQLTMMFEPGDIQFLNNHLTLHTRTAFTDWGDAERKRHLLRLWFSPPNSRPLSPGFKPFYRDISAGARRGGFPGHNGAQVFTTQ